MQPFNVYQQYDLAFEKGDGLKLWDQSGDEYLDFYGGHAVISIGHGHPRYVERLNNQLSALGYYSNAVKIPIQFELAEKLGNVCGMKNHQLFLVNSGAEAVENAIKLASFVTNKKKVVAFNGGFHGRTSLAVQATDGAKLRAPINESPHVVHIPLNDTLKLEETVCEQTACVIIEGIQGVGGLRQPTSEFWVALETHCKKVGALLIADEIQSGCGRTGKYFAFQKHGVTPDIVTLAKGIGNGFPVGAIIISDKIEPIKGQLGTTYGGNPLACAAALSVLETLENESLLEKVAKKSEKIQLGLEKIAGIKKIWGEGLMLGFDLNDDLDLSSFRNKLLYDGKIITGYSPSTKTVRLLPPLTVSSEEIDQLLLQIKASLI